MTAIFRAYQDGVASSISKCPYIRPRSSRVVPGSCCTSTKARSFMPARRAQALLGDHRRLAGEQRLSVMTSPRAVQAIGQTLAVPVLGGLHHQYVRARVSDRDTSPCVD